MSEDNNKKQNEPVKKPTEQGAKTELSKRLSEQELKEVSGGEGDIEPSGGKHKDW